MAWEIEGTDEFQQWFVSLTSAERVSVAARVDVLAERGPSLGRPRADTIHGSKVANLKELIIQHAGDPYRVLFAFDPRRVGILLLGARKPDDKWYQAAIPRAEKIYERYIEELTSEGLIQCEKPGKK